MYLHKHGEDGEPKGPPFEDSFGRLVVFLEHGRPDDNDNDTNESNRLEGQMRSVNVTAKT